MNKLPVFITGNPGKAAFLSKWLGLPIAHQALDLPEIQSMDLKEIAGYKAKAAYEILKSPVLVEDASLGFEALHGLPGPFIKWFLDKLTLQEICDLLQTYDNRSAVHEVCFCYYDGRKLEYFTGEQRGTIARGPLGETGFGFDPIMIPEGLDITYGQMNDEQLRHHALRTTQIFPQLHDFLANIDIVNK